MPSPVANALMPPPANPAVPPQGFWGNAGRFAYDALGLGDVAKALRGQMTPNEAQDFAFGAAAGLIPIGRGLKAAKGIRAYHGSPHDFDRFDMSKIGTGEGAQSYGHGFYLADDEAVARSYRDMLSKSGKGKMYEVNINAHPENFIDWDAPLSKQPRVVRDMAKGMPRDAPGSEVYSHVFGPMLDRELGRVSKPFNAKEYKAQWDDLLAGKDVNIEPLSVGPEQLAPAQYRASKAMVEAGIPGIKYLDQGSRTAGEGSRNYVVFDDKLIDIIRKYGLAALGLPPAMTMGAQVWNQNAASP
jgi:hypothetical protein